MFVFNFYYLIRADWKFRPTISFNLHMATDSPLSELLEIIPWFYPRSIAILHLVNSPQWNHKIHELSADDLTRRRFFGRIYSTAACAEGPRSAHRRKK